MAPLQFARRRQLLFAVPLVTIGRSEAQFALAGEKPRCQGPYVGDRAGTMVSARANWSGAI